MVSGRKSGQRLACAAVDRVGVVKILAYERYSLVDSDIVFFRPINLPDFRRPVPLRYVPDAICADAPLHVRCVESPHRLLGFGEQRFPADNFIGHLIFWNKSAVGALMIRIGRVTGQLGRRIT